MLSPPPVSLRRKPLVGPPTPPVGEQQSWGTETGLSKEETALAEAPHDITNHVKHSLISVFIALISQFVVMPASSYGLIKLAQFPSTTALGAMIFATCPGGSSSNLFTFLCGGDVSLSIMLTTISTVLAIGFMPLNMWIYARQWEGGDHLKVPYKSIAITLVWILVPLFFGMLAKRFTPKLANIINKVGSILGFGLIVAIGTLQYLMYLMAFHKDWKLWLIAAASPCVGFCFGYFLAFIAKKTASQCKAIAIETGMQSVSLATTIVVTSFPTYMHGEMTPFIIMTGIFTAILLLILAASIRIVDCFNKRYFSKVPVT
uniref:Ileal sodium/bile acid cotransporter n=1 Tax=Strigamia maritima TaxID=126957 RepID=T1IKK9_STRMM